MLLKFRLLRLYKKVEVFLKSHPFWPRFLSDGGLLALLFVGSIVFTVFCGRKSLTDINPVLKVIDLSIQGDELAELYKLEIYHDADYEIIQDHIYVEYGLTREDRAFNYDEYQFVSLLRNSGYEFDEDTVLISELSFKTADVHHAILSSHNWSKNEGNPCYFCVTDSISDHYYHQFNYCGRSMDTVAVFKNHFVGNLIGDSRNNPYIYLHFVLDGGYRIDMKNAFLIFSMDLDDEYNKVSPEAVNILSVFPEPTYVSPSGIIYKGDELLKLIRNNGFVFLGEDLKIKQKSDRSIFLWTVLFGTSITLSIEILVNLILKWRGILPRRRRHTRI